MNVVYGILAGFGLWLLGQVAFQAGRGLWSAVQTIRHRPRPVEPNPDPEAVQALLRPHGNVDLVPKETPDGR